MLDSVASEDDNLNQTRRTVDSVCVTLVQIVKE